MSAYTCFKSVAAALLVAIICTASGAQAEPKEVASVEGISEYQFDNGLRLLLFPDGSRPTVTVNLTVFVGSRHEGTGEGGMAHLLEHMVFKGTPDHEDIPRMLQERGAQFNGTTWFDRTNYYETLPATGDNLEFALRLEADRMMNSKILAEDLASEMTVVRNEFERSENSPSRVLSQKVFAAAYEWHNYGKPTIGNRSDIERVPVDALRLFYKKYYQPDNVMLVIAGRFERDQALELTQKYFGSIPRPERVLPKTYTVEPAQDGERKVVLRRVGEVGLVTMAYHIPSGSHADTAPLDVLGEILSRPPSGRLYKSVVETEKAAQAYAFGYSLHDPGVFLVSATVRPEKSLDEVQQLLLDEVESIDENGVTEEEVERSKRNLLNAHERSFANTQQLAISMSSWASAGDWRLFFLYRDGIEAVTAEDVQRVAKSYLRRSNRTLGLFIPTDEPMRVAVPESPDLAALVKDYKGRESVAAGEDFDPSPLAIEKRTTRTEIDGIKVALLPKKTRGEVVRGSLTLRYGNKENLREMQTAASLMPSLMTRGTKQLSRQELQDALDSNQATVTAAGGTGTATFTFETKKQFLPEVIGLLKQVVREPAFKEDEFKVVRQQQLASLESSKVEPQPLARTRLGRIRSPYPPEDVRYSPTIEEDIHRMQSVTNDQIKALYRDFLGATAGELVVVGDFDPETTLDLAKDALGGWTAKMPYERIDRQADVSVKGQHHTIETPDKANAVYFAGIAIPLQDNDKDYAAVMIGNRVLGSSGLSSRLGNRVRQKDGLSYGVGSMLSAGSLDPRSLFSVFAISNPANSDKVVKAIDEELKRLLKDGITETELEEAKQGYLQRAELGRTNDSTLRSTLSGTLVANRTMQYYADLEMVVKDLDVETVNEALRKHLKIDRLIVVTAGDFAGADKPEESAGDEEE